MPHQTEASGGYKPRLPPGPPIGGYRKPGWRPVMGVVVLLACCIVLAALSSLVVVFVQGPRAAPAPVYRDVCPPEFPLQVIITYKTVCIAGVTPKRERVDEH